MDRTSGSFSPIKISQYQTAASKTHYLVPLFTNTISAFMRGQDPTVMTREMDPFMSGGHEFLKSVVGYDHYANEDDDLAFAIAVKDAVSMDEDTLFFTCVDSGKTPFENYSRIFTIKDAQNIVHQYVLRNGGTDQPQIELVLLDRFATIEKASAIAIFPGINLDDLRQAISPDVAKVDATQSGEASLVHLRQAISPEIANVDAMRPGGDAFFPPVMLQDITSSYPDEIKNLIVIFEKQNLQIDNVKNGLTNLIVESGRARVIVAIKEDAGIFRQYRLTETAGNNISIESVTTPSAELSKAYDEIFYKEVGNVSNLSLAKIKSLFPSPLL